MSYKLKIRKTTTKNVCGDTYGVTIPRRIAERYLDTRFRVLMCGNNLVLESGAMPQ